MLLFSKVRFFKYLLLSFIFFALDQISKALIKIKFPIGFDGVFTTSEGLYEIPIIEPILMIKRISNKGINENTLDTIDDLIGYLILLKIAWSEREIKEDK